MMGKVKQLWQDEIDQAIDEYHDEINSTYGIFDLSRPTARSFIKRKADKAKKRLVSKLHANGCSADHIEEIVNCECR